MNVTQRGASLKQTNPQPPPGPEIGSVAKLLEYSNETFINVHKSLLKQSQMK